MAADSFGNTWISGSTSGSLGGIHAGNYDAFLVKFTVPESGTLCLLAVAGAVLVRRRRGVL